MSRAKMKLNNMLKWRTKSTTDLSEWNKNDEKLLKAVEAGSLHKVQSILHKKSVAPSKLGPKGLSVFHIACEKGLLDIVDALIKHDADVNCLTIQGSSALHLAANHGWAGIIQKLLQAGASVDVEDSCSQIALHYACFSKSLECVQFLLHYGSNPNIKDSNGRSPIFVAVNYGSVPICKELLDKGANVNLQDFNEMSPLMVACQQHNKEICELLLKRGANPQSTDAIGHNAAWYAADSNSRELKEVLERAPARASWDIKKDDSAENVTDGRNINKTDVMAFEPDSPGQSSKEDKKNVSVKVSVEDSRQTQINNEMRESLEKEKEEHMCLKKMHKELEEEHEKINEELHQGKLENKKLLEQLDALLLQNKEREQKEEEARNLNVKSPDSPAAVKENIDGKEPQKLLETDVDSASNQAKDDWGDSDEDLFGSTDDMSAGKFSKEERQTFSLLRTKIEELSQENIQLKEQLQIQAQNTTNNSNIKEDSQMKMEQSFQTNNIEQENVKADIPLQSSIDVEQSLEITIPEFQGDGQESQKSNRSNTESPNSLFDHNIDTSLKGLDPELINFKMMESENSRLKQEYLALQRDLDRLQSNYSALVEAGDNLQDEYDQLLSEKEILQVEFQTLSQEKEDLVKENEFLLSDGNALHDDLEKLVNELEKMQEKYKKLQNETQLLNNTTASDGNEALIVATEERDNLTKKCEELKCLVELLKERQQSSTGTDEDLKAMCSELEKERNDSKDQLEILQCKYESIDNQHLALKQDYSQLEQDFSETLAEKDRIERELHENNSGQTESKFDVLLEERNQMYEENNALSEEKEQLELTIAELSKVNALLEEKISELELNSENVKNSEISLGSPSVEKERRIRSLQIQISRLQQQLAESDRKNKDIINTYRTHLISSVQGHLDEDVKAAIHHIIELRSVEQFC